MKKIIISFVAVFFCVPAFAQLTQGKHILGGRLGLGFQLENSGVSYSDDDRVDWGEFGAEYGLSYYYLWTEHVGVGADLSYGDFDGGELFSSIDDVDNKTKLFNAMFSARFTLNPTHTFRWYIPVGVGLTMAQQDMHINKNGLNYAKKATDTSLGYFIGAGFEFDLGGHNRGWSMGLETRYNSFRYDTDKLTRNAPTAIQGDGNRHLSYLSFQLRVNKRF